MDNNSYLSNLRNTREILLTEFYHYAYRTSGQRGSKEVASRIYEAIYDVEQLIFSLESHNREMSPMTLQFNDLKAKHPEATLLFRCGDFYEAYNEDAKTCAKILGITLTWRNSKGAHDYNTYEGAMAGFPHHALDTYLPKLIRAGKRVAICDQLEDPKLTKKVQRGITELVTPGINN